MYLQPTFHDQGFDECLVHGNVGRYIVEDLAKGDHFAQPRDLQAQLVFQAQAEMCEQADQVIGSVDRDLVGAGHADGRIGEHPHQALDGVFVRQRVTALEHADLLASVLQEEVDGCRLSLTAGLHDDLDARILPGVRLDNRDRAVSAAAADHDDLSDATS